MSRKKNEAPAFHVEVDRADLLKAVTRAAAVVESRNTVPILSFVQLAMGFGTLAVTGTNLDSEMRVEIEAHGEGATCLPAYRLRDMLRALPDAQIVMTGDESGIVTLRSGETEITYGSLPANDHPVLAVDNVAWSLTLPDGVFAYLIGGASGAMSTEETRYYLNGVCLEVKDGQAIAVATDGHRLVSRTSNLSGNLADQPSIIIPRDAVRVALAQVGGGEVKLIAYGPVAGQRATKLEIVAGGARLRSKLIDGTFPDWRRVVPTSEKSVCSVGLPNLRRALQMAKANSTERGRAVKLSYGDGTIRLTSDNPDTGKLSTRLPCQVTAPFPDIGMNADYLRGLADAAERIGSKSLRLHLNGPGEPVRILPDEAIVGAMAVLMPMRV
ncbi:DNA polymerase III subunit beta [Methylobacterium sp. J-092]|uniref:DNA polymerase III subunit beta n=1 Tax=Methylobacterium sp. J-092 TaxID=2836667 RepID=UPI001FB98351|nr:DNA polymerase III subunit beta [Methylobacterium sp. J-092]MCJ2009783.1 DNA polymerase III subunit beta [Methylobacterium sp. J-092]